VCTVRLAWLAAALLVLTTPTAAVQPQEPQPGAPRRPKLIGREQNGHTFRKPGTLLHRARRAPPRVDPGALRRRKIDQVARRVRHTSALAPVQTPAGSDDQPAVPPDEETVETAVAAHGPLGVRTWHILIFMGLTAAAVIAVLRVTGRRR
jgi:hypothetical protein